jgi:hypothetical protein
MIIRVGNHLADPHKTQLNTNPDTHTFFGILTASAKMIPAIKVRDNQKKGINPLNGEYFKGSFGDVVLNGEPHYDCYLFYQRIKKQGVLLVQETKM